MVSDSVRDSYTEIRVYPCCVGMRLVEANCYDNGSFEGNVSERKFENHFTVGSFRSKFNGPVVDNGRRTNVGGNKRDFFRNRVYKKLSLAVGIM